MKQFFFAAALMVISMAASAQIGRYLVTFKDPAILEQDPTILKIAGSGSANTSRAKAIFASAQAKQTQRLDAASTVMGMKLQPVLRVLYTNNLVALDLTEADAARLRLQPGVASVEREFMRNLNTDVSPGFVGATALWQDSAGQSGERGAGVLVGVIDSGIDATHPSFAEQSSDGYQFPQLFAPMGLCTSSTASRCNRKLVGIYDFTTEGARDGSDLNGHGTHVASTAVGNPTNGTINAPTTTFQLPISGIAPRAHLISYKACTQGAGGPPPCAGSALIMAIERAVLDGVRVLNYSIGGASSDPFAALDATISNDIRSMFNARAAGMVISVSAGNQGPNEFSVNSPANAPWVIAVANISHDRLFQTRLVALSGSINPPQLSFNGAGISAAVENRPIVLAERYGFRLCGQGEDQSLPPTGISNPFAPGTFNGEIVVCERGTQARVAKGFNLKQAGAGGMILVNTSVEGESIVADEHYLPTVHLGQADGAALVAWLRQAANARGSIEATQAVRNPSLGDLFNLSSSVGPIGLDFLKPDLAAPGSNILAAAAGGGIKSLSGTSMAAPHVAGAAALLRALHPNWGADEIESALRSSALGGKIRSGATLASIDQVGSGRLRVDQAARMRVFFPNTTEAMRAARNNPSSMNLPSLWSSACRNRCSFRRELRGSADLVGEANFSMHLLGAPAGLEVTMRPAQFTISANQSQILDFDVVISDARLAGPVLNAMVELRAPGLASMQLPLRVQVPSAIPKTQFFDVTTRRGQLHVQLSGLVALPRPSARLTPFAAVVSELATLPTDSTPEDPFNAGGTRYRPVTITVQDGYLWARIRGNAPLVELYAGKDDDGNQSASATETRCKQIQNAVEKICLVALSGPGNYWVHARNAGTSTSSPILDIAVIDKNGSEVNSALMPGNVPENATFPFSFSYDLNGNASAMGSRHIAVLDVRADARAEAVFSQSFVEVRLVGSAENTTLLLKNQRLNRVIAAGQSLSNIGFSLPTGTQSARITAQSSGNLALELYRAGPEEANFVGIANGSAVLAQAQDPTGLVVLNLSGAQASGGRYYLRVRNSGTTAQVVALTLAVENTAQSALEPELYYNPARSGHGMLITRAGNDAQMIWYTYDHLGNPTWYWFFANGYYGTNPGVVTGPITRYTWDGARASAGVVVGQGAITQTGNNKFVFDFDVLGLSGSEPMELLGRSGCAQGSGISAPADFTGAWYQPSTTGWGASVHMSPTIEFTNFFIYDGIGQPRWVLGQEEFANGVSLNPKSVTLYQHLGFCPTCTFVQNTRRAVGSYRLRFDPLPPVAYADVELNVTYLDTLAGQFNRTGDFYLLTDRKRCLP